jgi:hypothetical protein
LKAKAFLALAGTLFIIKIANAQTANPTATIGLTVVNGTAITTMRSDGAPPLSQAIVPTWTGTHTFSNATYSALFTGGNVGIGTTTPSAPMQIVGTNTFPQFRVTGSGTGSAIYGSFLSMDATPISGGKDWLMFSTAGSASEGTGKLIFKNQTDLVYGLTITSTGDVGLGTQSPLSKLQVQNGSILFDGTTGSTPTSGAGTRMMWVPSKGAFRAGSVLATEWDAANIGTNSIAFGAKTRASGTSSSAFGDSTTASGAQSTAFGSANIASGDQSFVTGFNAIASGKLSCAFGDHATSQAYNSFVIGKYNVISGTTTSWVSTDPLFVIGNGSFGALNNALTVLKNGNVGIGTATPGYQLELTGQIKIAGGSPGAGKVLVSDANGVASWSASSSGGWSITGNSGTSSSTNFIGTTDNVALVFKVNNTKAGKLDPSGPTFFGYLAGNSNTGASVTGIGYQALYSNTTGIHNVGIGYQALYANTTGQDNNAIGYQTLSSITSGLRNCALGNNVLNTCATGSDNTGIGSGVLQISTGDDNTGVGSLALYYNTTGTNNTGVGTFADYNTSTGSRNTGIGTNSLSTNTTGSDNTTIGYNSNVNTSSRANSLAVGASAVVNADAKGRVGDINVTAVETQTAWTTVSDGRFKTNISENDVVGLDFIKRLRPVVYNFDTKLFQEFLVKNMPDSIKQTYMNRDFTQSTAIRQSGFIAQEVEAVAKETGYDFNGVYKPKDGNDNYSISYSHFVVPLVKAVQEQQKMIDSLKIKTSMQDSINSNLQKQINQLTAIVNNTGLLPKTASSNSVELTDKNIIVLDQNIPNPFAEETVINYFLPDNVTRAQIIFLALSGEIIKSVELMEKGKGSLHVFANDLSNGIYTYSLIIDGQTIETRKMIKSK